MTPVLCIVAENPLVQKAKESRGCLLGGLIMKWTFNLKIPFTFKFHIFTVGKPACPLFYTEMRLQCREAENPLVQKAKESRGCS